MPNILLPETVHAAPATTGNRNKKRPVAVAVGPLLALALFFILPDSLAVEARAVAASALLMAVWWMTEAFPIPVTALLPLVLFPFLGIATVDKAAAPYANSIVFLILGGVLLGLAVQRWNLHQRIALLTVLAFGTRPSQIVLGLMVASGFISAWVSNTATAVIMVPIALSVIQLVKTAIPTNIAKFAASVLLGVAYSITLGGFGTLIGQPVNPLLAAYLRDSHGITIGFGQWMLFGVPFAIIFIGLAWVVLTKFVFRAEFDNIPGGRELFQDELKKLGALGVEEKRVLGIFGFAVFGWLVLPFIAKIPAVATGMPWLGNVNDTSIAVMAGVLAFMVPASRQNKGTLLSWKQTVEVPWGVLLLIGGGMALSAQFTATGLSTWIGEQMGGLEVFPAIVLLAAVAVVLILLTELTSNTATAAAFLPVMGAVAVGAALDPVLMSLTVAMAVTCAFMLPVATPSNAVAYATGELEMRDMVRGGVWLNLVGVLITLGMLCTLAPLAFGVAP